MKSVYLKSKRKKWVSFLMGMALVFALVLAVPEESRADGGLVGINDLQNYTSLKKNCSNEEFQAAYNAAQKIVKPLVGKSRKKQVTVIVKKIRARVDSGKVAYSMDAPHYNDPYGYFVTGVGSCAGSVRATGLCLNMLGIPYEHVHENEYSHQWVRVKVGKEYWIADAYGLTLGPEPAPYEHPYL